MINKIYILIICIFSFGYSQSQNDSICLVVKNTTKNVIDFPFFKSNRNIYLFTFNQSNDTLYIEYKPNYTVWKQDNKGGYYYDGMYLLVPRKKYKFRIYNGNEKDIKTIVIYSKNYGNYEFYFKRKNGKYISKKIVPAGARL